MHIWIDTPYGKQCTKCSAIELSESTLNISGVILEQSDIESPEDEEEEDQ